MCIIADLMAAILLKKQRIAEIKRKVRELRLSYQSVNYCFNSAQLDS